MSNSISIGKVFEGTKILFKRLTTIFEEIEIKKPKILTEEIIIDNPVSIDLILWGMRDDIHTKACLSAIHRVLLTYSGYPIRFEFKEPKMEDPYAPVAPYPKLEINHQLFCVGEFDQDFLMEHLNTCLKILFELREEYIERYKKIKKNYDYIIVNKNWNLTLDSNREFSFILVNTDTLTIKGLDLNYPRDGIPFSQDILNKLISQGYKILDFTEQDKELLESEYRAAKTELGEKIFRERIKQYFE